MPPELEKPEEEIDEEWLLAQPIEGLQEHCVELGLSDDGSAEELAARIVNKLEDLEEQEEEDDDDEEGESETALREQEEVAEAATQSKGKGPRLSRDDDDDNDDDATMDDDDATRDQLEQLRAERAAGRREPGSVANERLRASLSVTERLALADELKEGANGLFRAGSNGTALGGYLAAIWLLKPHEPPCPNALASAIWLLRPNDPRCPSSVMATPPPWGHEGTLLLGEGRPPLSRRKQAAMEALGAPECAALRESLHLNVAATALPLGDWDLAAAACHFVLRRSTHNAKARYRLAQAHSGAGELKAASRELIALLKIEGEQTNRDARQLLKEVQARSLERRAAKARVVQRRRIELRLKDEAEAEEAAEASVRREEDLLTQRTEAAVRVREPPRVGARVSVYWVGDLKWEEGEVIAEIPPAQCRESVPRLQHRVRYLDGFEHVHDLCSAHRHAFEYELLAAPPARVTVARRRLGALGSKALNTLGIKPAQVCDNLTLDAAVGFGCIGLVLLPAIAMVYGLLAGPG